MFVWYLEEEPESRFWSESLYTGLSKQRRVDNGLGCWLAHHGYSVVCIYASRCKVVEPVWGRVRSEAGPTDCNDIS